MCSYVDLQHYSVRHPREHEYRLADVPVDDTGSIGHRTKSRARNCQTHPGVCASVSAAHCSVSWHLGRHIVTERGAAAPFQENRRRRHQRWQRVTGDVDRTCYCGPRDCERGIRDRESLVFGTHWGGTDFRPP